MRRGLVAFSALALIGLAVTGCGLSRFEQREPWRLEAEQACLSRKLVQPSSYMSRSSEIEGPGACGITYPFKVAAFADGSIGVAKPLTLGCPMIPPVEAWLADTVQPAASLYLGSPVLEIRSGSYSCRPRNSQRGAKLSEHAFGNAVDVMAFRLADGREVSIVKGWRGGAPEEQEFLREVFVGACRHFNTVLGPGSDMFHYDHFHLDLARHDPRGERRICKPVIKFAPRLQEGGGGQSYGRPRLPETWRAPPAQAPIEMEEDDPFETSARTAPKAPALAYDRAPPSPPARPQAPPALAEGPARPIPPLRTTRPVGAPIELQSQGWGGQGIY